MHFFIQFEGTSCPCEGCTLTPGAPDGFVVKGLKGKPVQEMRNQLLEHGVNVEGMKGPQLKAEVEKLVDLHAKVLPIGS